MCMNLETCHSEPLSHNTCFFNRPHIKITSKCLAIFYYVTFTTFVIVQFCPTFDMIFSAPDNTIKRFLAFWGVSRHYETWMVRKRSVSGLNGSSWSSSSVHSSGRTAYCILMDALTALMLRYSMNPSSISPT